MPRNPVPLPSASLVSVIIPCYNQGHFLAEAIDSVRAQSYREVEIVVIDDGSTDETAQVAGGYREVVYLRQERGGLAAARNRGLAMSKGAFLVFLDADDRLLPEALEVGVRYLRAFPQCALVAGRYILITADGSAIPFSPRPVVDREHYREFLRANFIGMPAVAICRRSVFDAMDGFKTTLAACEDYEFYLRVAREFPIHCHDTVVAEYRQHATNMSRDYALMLRTSLSVLRAQRPFVRNHPRHRQAYDQGKKHWQDYYGGKVARQIRRHLSEQQWQEGFRGLSVLLRWHPKAAVRLLWQAIKAPLSRRVKPVLTKLPD